uniref:C-type lectin 1 n=1 Tax=Branchiostoma belcheri TaxID=7741 RepID=B4XWC2_BRABE|nr:c-type lectin 1 [Branchiostoma belcheri]
MRAAMAMWKILILMGFITGSTTVTRYERRGYEYWVNGHRNYWEARDACRNSGGHLVDIKTQGLENFLKDTFLGNRNIVWIGLIEQSGGWKWSDGTTSHVSGGWHWHEPNDGFTVWDNQDCGSWVKVLGDWGWDDRYCDDRYASICQRGNNASA